MIDDYEAEKPLMLMIVNLIAINLNQIEHFEISFTEELNLMSEIKLDVKRFENKLSLIHFLINKKCFLHVFFLAFDIIYPENEIKDYFLEKKESFNLPDQFDRISVELIFSFVTFGIKDKTISAKMIKLLTQVYQKIKLNDNIDSNLSRDTNIGFQTIFGMYFLIINDFASAKKILESVINSSFDVQNTRFFFLALRILIAISQTEKNSLQERSLAEKSNLFMNNFEVPALIADETVFIVPPLIRILPEL